MPTVGMTGTQQRLINEMNKALNTAATRYNQALMGQMQLLKGEGLVERVEVKQAPQVLQLPGLIVHFCGVLPEQFVII